MGGWRGCLGRRVALAAWRLTGAPVLPAGERRGCCATAFSARRPEPPQPPSAWRRCCPASAFLRQAPPRFLLRAGGAELFPFTPASALSSRFTHHLSGAESQEMPAAPRPDCQSDDEFEPQTLLEPEAALESSGGGRMRKVCGAGEGPGRPGGPRGWRQRGREEAGPGREEAQTGTGKGRGFA